ncbi:pyridoxamine 5'-phosphate oxidase family protein [Chroococcidiopsis sp.]|uniref:pyridoxamine 5'-phosphate oxidase family protein n=1 Tax=Chroococcidiopsis sp. TaxID=3088168 RepID=UPI003F3E9EB6
MPNKLSTYHAGELAVQAQAGVQAEAARLTKIIGANISSTARDFLDTQRLAIASTIDRHGKVWASLLVGKPGFVEVVAEQLVQIQTTTVSTDLLLENLSIHDDIGILIIDLATRRRLRINGKAMVQPNGYIDVRTQQVYFNCPKYIQVRDLVANSDRQAAVTEVYSYTALTPAQQQWITQADTFFIASFHPQSGADASHRGGYPGFVQVLNATELVFPDYTGNNMFNTLGNIAQYSQIGLLFVDFVYGHTLQLTGTANIIWDTNRIAQFIGAESLVEFQIDRVIETINATNLSWEFAEYSPYNPK